MTTLAIGCSLPGAQTFVGDARDSDAVRAALTGCERVVYQPQIRGGLKKSVIACRITVWNVNLTRPT